MTMPNGSPSPLQSRSWLLPAIVAIAVFIHLGFLYTLHDMHLVASGSSSSLKYDDNAIRREQNAADIMAKDEQLAHVFSQIYTEATGGQVTTVPKMPKGDDFTPPSLTELPVEWQAVALDFSMPLAAEPPITFQDYAKVPLAVEVVLPSDKLVVNEIVLATEALLGDVALLTSQEYNPYSVRGGRTDLASLYGNAHDNASGNQHGADLDRTSHPNLIGAQDMAAVDATLRNIASSEQRNLELSQQLSAALTTRENDGDRSQDAAEASGRVASSSDFNVSIEYAPRKRGGGYYFKVALTPRSEVVFKTIRNNIFFLIDRSQSIDKARYVATKAAVMDALGLLRAGDKFNILVFDDKIVALSAQCVSATANNIAAARDFISQQPHGALLGSTDLYASLGNVIPEAVGLQEVNTAILLSDGVTYKSKDSQRKNIASWTADNGGKVALYSLAVGKGNNLALLDLLANLNRGCLTYCANKDQVDDTMVSLMRSLRNPIGKDMKGSVVPLQDGCVVELYPRQGRLPNLYKDTSYELYGWVSSPDDFYLFVQGRYYDRFLDIKQRISFKEGKQVHLDKLERQLAILHAYDLYEHYLHSGKTSAIAEVRQLLSPHNVPVAFQ